jgi:hypothetical protein
LILSILSACTTYSNLTFSDLGGSTIANVLIILYPVSLRVIIAWE